MTKKYKGIPIVEGLGYGKAHIVGRALKDFKIEKIGQNKILEEIDRFEKVREDVKSYYKNYRNSLDDENQNEILQIYEHMIDDPAFTGKVTMYVTSKKYSLETSIRSVSKEFIDRFNASDTTYFRERASDMVEICEKLISTLNNGTTAKISFAEDVILVVNRSLTPSDLISFDLTKVKAVISESAGKTSHAAILARTYSVPVITGVNNLLDKISAEDNILVNAYTGEFTIDPDSTEIEHYHKYVEDVLSVKNSTHSRWKAPIYTRDGVPIKIMSNISFQTDVELISENGSDGIGLVRTEYLLSERDSFPTEDEQFEYYSYILKSNENKEAIIRVMDIGGDKAAKFLKMPKEENPFMGWRAVRILLERTDLFETQIRAILRAGKDYSNYKIMFPMVTALSEWKKLKEFTENVAKDLNIECPPLGILFEVPLAILEIETFLKSISFASIGTNDLLQYLSAADRNNTTVNYLYNPLEPAFLRIIKTAIDTCKDNGIPISICGEMAGNPIYTLLLVGLGLNRFSVIPNNIPIIKEIVSNLSFIELQEEISHLLTIDNSESIKEWIDIMNDKLVGDVLRKYHIGTE